MKIVNAVLRRLISRAGRGSVRVGSHRFVRRRFLPSSLYASEEHEPWLDPVLAAALRAREGTVIDVGVNVGQTLFKILRLDREREYLGFEPQAGPCFFVEQFIAENGLRNHRVLPIALSNAAMPVELRIRGSGDSSLSSTTASLVEGFRPADFYDWSKLIYAAPGDSILAQLGLTSIALIKIDVEGAELEVLEGLSATLASQRPIVVLEVLHHYLAVTDEPLDARTIAFRDERLGRLEGLLRGLRYRIFQIQGDGSLRERARIEPKKVSELATTDYVAVPDDAAETFLRAVEAVA